MGTIVRWHNYHDCMHSCNQHPDNKYACIQIHRWVSGLRYFFRKHEGWDPHNALRQLQYMVLVYLDTKYMYLPLQYFQIFTLEDPIWMYVHLLSGCWLHECIHDNYVPDVSPRGAYCLCPYVSTYVCMCVFFINFIPMVNKKQIFTNGGKIKCVHIASILGHLESKCFIHLESLFFHT